MALSSDTKRRSDTLIYKYIYLGEIIIAFVLDGLAVAAEDGVAAAGDVAVGRTVGDVREDTGLVLGSQASAAVPVAEAAVAAPEVETAESKRAAIVAEGRDQCNCGRNGCRQTSGRRLPSGTIARRAASRPAELAPAPPASTVTDSETGTEAETEIETGFEIELGLEPISRPSLKLLWSAAGSVAGAEIVESNAVAAVTCGN